MRWAFADACRGLAALVLPFALLLAAPLAAAQYPSRPIHLLIPIPPGGGPDVVGRLVAASLGDALGQPVVVENRVGGNGNVAGELVARAPADGHTLLLGMDSLLAINPHVYAKMPFDALTDLVPVASLVRNGFFLVVNPKIPARTLAEFVDYARHSNPPLHYGSGGNGSQHHFTMERLKARAGISLDHVPYKGGAPATTATVAGDVAAMMSGTSTAPQIKAGKLRVLAYTGPQRSVILPDVPTVAETYPEFEMTQWYGLFAPAGTPEPVLARLRAEVSRILQQPDMRERLLGAGGIEIWITAPVEFSQAIRSDHAKFARLARELAVKID
jgi:tripartite-type tricarboxylate transporter receptor subunit TctC